MDESFFEGAARETLEETGLTVAGVRVAGVTNDVFDAATRHYVTVFVECRVEGEGEEPKVGFFYFFLLGAYFLSSFSLAPFLLCFSSFALS